MSLETWLSNGWIKKHSTSKKEISSLFAVVERDIQEAQKKNISADWRFNIGYNGILQLALAALAADGYRVSTEGHHFRAIQSLALTVPIKQDEILLLDSFRKKRNIGFYDRAGTISETEVKELLSTALKLRDTVLKWFRAKHPELVPV